jgi:acyl carrier protein
MSDEDELLKRLRPILAQRLFVELEEVQPNSRLIDDLQVDSLDFVDLQYALEEQFHIRFGHGEFFEPTQQWINKDGSIKTSAIDRMSEIMPDLIPLAQQGPVSVKTFFELVTVDTLTRLIRRQQAHQDNSPPENVN